MKHLLLLLLCVAGAFPIAARAQAPVAPVATAPAAVAYEYATASIQSRTCREWRLFDTDLTHPTGQFYVQDEQGKKQSWHSQAEVLNYLASLGWEILPLGVNAGTATFHYMLRKPAR